MNLLFLDCETTGLSPKGDKLLEVGCVVVSLPTFAIVAETNHVFHFDVKDAITKGLYIHPKVIEMHDANGLWTDCYRSQLVDYQKMDALVQRFIVDNECQGTVLAGANPSFDRDFLKAFTPGTANLLHYRNFDTNTFWLLQEFITGEKGTRVKPASHRAVDDCKDAVGVVEKHFDFMEKLING
jgi:oligoribonuclease